MLLDLKRVDGTPLFQQIRLGLACQMCMDSGEAASCTHMSHVLPSWLSSERSEQARLLYQADEASYLREARGLVASDQRYVFDKRSIKLMQLREPYIFEDPMRVRTIHVGLDPHGGGSTSDFAILSINWIQGRKVVSSHFHFISFS